MIAYTAGAVAVAAALMLPTYAATRVRLTPRGELLAAWSTVLGVALLLAVVGGWEVAG